MYLFGVEASNWTSDRSINILLEKYKHTEPTLKPNKKQLKLNSLYLNDIDVEEFNKIYQYCKKHYTEVKATQSKGISNKVQYRFKERFTVINGNQYF